MTFRARQHCAGWYEKKIWLTRRPFRRPVSCLGKSATVRVIEREVIYLKAIQNGTNWLRLVGVDHQGSVQRSTTQSWPEESIQLHLSMSKLSNGG